MIGSVQLYNFQSWQRLVYHFNGGVTLVTGQNIDDNTAEGSGKSAIFNAITWCLWGKLPKDTNIDDVIQLGCKETCEVTLYTDSGYRITRTRNPNDLYFMTPEGEILPTDAVRGKDMKETQKMINEIVGMSFETFCQSIYFPQNYEKKFITSNEEEKAKILSEIQDLTVFDRASKKANENAKIQSIEIEKVRLNILAIERQYASLKSQLKTLELMEAGFIAKKVQDLSEFDSRITKNKSSIESLQNNIAGLGPIKGILGERATTLNSLQKDLTDIENKLYAIELIKKQKSAMPGICPTCSRAFESDKCEVEIPDDSLLLASRDNVKGWIIATIKDIDLIHENKAKYDRYISNIDLLQTEQKQLLKDLEKLKNSKNDYEDKIYLILEQLNSLTGDLSGLRSTEDEMRRSLEIFNFLKSGFKEIKSHAFQSLLNDLNVKSNYYLREFFDIPCSIRFTNISDEGELSKIQTKVTLNNNEYTLGLLSGGQMRRVQLAVDFAISEIIAIRSNQKINMRILDEPFKDLSEKKMVKILEFLKKMPGKTIIIEHSPIIKSFVDRELRIELKYGISKLTSN